MYLVAVLFKIFSFSHPPTSEMAQKRKSQTHGASPTAAQAKAALRNLPESSSPHLGLVTRLSDHHNPPSSFLYVID